MTYDGLNIIKGRPYATVFLPKHHLAQKDGTIGVHILVAEKMLGRNLTAKEVVHHKDFNKYNNEESNLMIFDSRKSHGVYHACLRYGYDYELVRTQGVYSCRRLTKTEREQGHLRRLTKTKREHSDYFICPICGKHKPSTTHKDGRCFDCYNLHRRAESRCPEKAELESALVRKSFRQVGIQYGVSDNTVRKWCRRLGLPDKASSWRNKSQ